MDNSFIKLHRRILRWEWYTDPNMVHFFIHLLLKANFKEGKFRGISVKRGQLITGRLKLATDTGLSEMQVRTCIKKLKSTKEISVKVTNKYTLITICNYEDYQNNDSDESVPSNQQDNHQISNNQPSSNQRVTIIEEELRREEGKEEIMAGTPIFKMLRVFKQFNPSYPEDNVRDATSILQIINKICKMNKWDTQRADQHEKEILKQWEEIVIFILSDTWYSKRALYDLNNEWQRLIQSKNSSDKPKHITPPHNAKSKVLV